MVDATLRSGTVSYPTISAVANGKLVVDRDELVDIGVSVGAFRVIAARSSTSDPWEISVSKIDQKGSVIYSVPAVTIDSNSLGWKSMADLAHKCYVRSVDKKVLTCGSATSFPVVSADATKPCGYAHAGPTSINGILALAMDVAGHLRLAFTPNGSQFPVMLSGGTASLQQQVTNIITAILANTTDTQFQADTTNGFMTYGDESTNVRCSQRYTLKEMSGTENLTVGNYVGADVLLTVEIPAYGGNADFTYQMVLDAGDTWAMPSILLDMCRRACAGGATPRLLTTRRSEDQAILVKASWYTSGAAKTLMQASPVKPEGMIETDFDQANSMNVLATAAFAGLTGLAAVGTATELERLLANSPLSATFANIASMLGATTAATITGYATALIAAYTNGWITNEQLFDLSSHVGWLSAGYRTILAASAVGVGIGSVNSLLGYLGVSSDILSTAITAAGGAATGAGIALGMASVLAKCVRHSYWGE